MKKKVKKYEVEYGRITVHYTQEKLQSVLSEYRLYEYELNDHDYLEAAVKHFCATHFMWRGAAHMKQYDAETRGRKLQEWEYQPNGKFKGWIYARVIEE